MQYFSETGEVVVRKKVPRVIEKTSSKSHLSESITRPTVSYKPDHGGMDCMFWIAILSPWLKGTTTTTVVFFILYSLFLSGEPIT